MKNFARFLLQGLSLLCCCSVESRHIHRSGAFATASRAPAFLCPSLRSTPFHTTLASASSDESVHVKQEEVHDPSSVLCQETIDSITNLVEERAEARWVGDYERADALRHEIMDTVIQDYMIFLKDLPRTEGGGATWSLVRYVPSRVLSGPTVLHLAHTALGLAVASSENVKNCITLTCKEQQEQCDIIVQQARLRMQQIQEGAAFEMQGRKAADAAFWFALAGCGCNDGFPELLVRLADSAAEELERFGTRDSCRVKDVLQIMQRFAAAGLTHHDSLQSAAQKALLAKNVSMNSTMTILDFFSDECLLMIWKFSTRQRKQRIFLEMARNHFLRRHQAVTAQNPARDETVTIDWYQMFQDPTRPLVVDIGCGMGVSLLGLAKAAADTNKSEPTMNDDQLCMWSNCNFAGVDLSGLAIRYAQSLRVSWNLQDRICFFVDSAEQFLHNVATSYPGPVHLCMIQFPTPYRLNIPSKIDDGNGSSGDDTRGNTQLPENSASENFMVSMDLLKQVKETLDPAVGKLLVQSNCEDVAVWIRSVATEECNYGIVEIKSLSDPCKELSPTKRTLDWVAGGGGSQRARGFGWNVGPVLPRQGRTETEVACMLNAIPVHRCVLQTQLLMPP